MMVKKTRRLHGGLLKSTQHLGVKCGQITKTSEPFHFLSCHNAVLNHSSCQKLKERSEILRALIYHNDFRAIYIDISKR